jgi:hypothetical protein
MRIGLPKLSDLPRSIDDLGARLAWAKGGHVRGGGALGRALLMRPFPKSATTRILLAYQGHRLAVPQFNAFLRYSDRFAARGIHFRAIPTEALSVAKLPPKLDALFLQSTDKPGDGELERLLSSLKATRPDLKISYFDWFAPTDVRFAERVEPWVDFYLKKSLLRDRASYAIPTIGHTTMVDHFAPRFAVENPPRTWDIPPAIIPKIGLSTAFSTAPALIALFERDLPPAGRRDIDLHSRIAVKGLPWYAQMRAEAKAAVTAHFGDLVVASEGLVPHAEFMNEMERSKLCFSPFGYGEICWRDFEAIAAGSVLIKQDMSTVETDPDIYLPDETYIPVAWDLSDLEPKVRALLADPARQRRIAERAFAVLRDHLRGPALEQLVMRLALSPNHEGRNRS